MISDIYISLTQMVHKLAGDLAGGEPMAKGLITVGIIGALAALGRNIPSKIWKGFKKRFTVSVKVEDIWYGRNKDLYRIFGDFVARNQVGKQFIASAWSDEDIYDADKISIIPDYGSGIFFVKGIPFYYLCEVSREKGSVPTNLTITTLGRNSNVIWDQLEVMKKMSAQRVRRKFYMASKEEWRPISDMGQPPAIFLPEKIKAEIDKKIDFYKDNKDWYTERGIPRKLLIVIYGPPGTGKSRLSRYVADRLNMSLGTVQDGSDFSVRMRTAAERDIVVSIPDFDTLNIAVNRDQVEGETLASAAFKELDKFKLNEVLNLFQGDIPVNNLVVVMSTNYINQIDSALLRRGRTDLLLELTYLGYPEVNAFYKHHYNSTDDLPSSLGEILIKACDLNAAFEDSPFDKDGFIASLMQN